MSLVKQRYHQHTCEVFGRHLWRGLVCMQLADCNPSLKGTVGYEIQYFLNFYFVTAVFPADHLHFNADNLPLGQPTRNLTEFLVK